MKLKFPLLGITGWSGSGKTTLIEKLMPMLTEQGYRVNVIKSSHHDIQLEPEKKDSARVRAAGAAEVMLSCPYRYMLVRELRNKGQATLHDLIERMTPADMILVEGFRQESIPKLEVYRATLGKSPMYETDARIMAVASDIPCPDSLPRPIDWLNLNDLKKIYDWLFIQTSHI